MHSLTLPVTPIDAPGPARLIENLSCGWKEACEVSRSVVVVDGDQTVAALWDLSDHSFNAEFDDLLATFEDESRHRVIVIYRFETRLPSDQLRELAGAIIKTFAAHKHRILDVLLVGKTHWWSALCTDADCCPPLGRARPNAPTGITSRQRRIHWRNWQEFAGIDPAAKSVSENAVAEMVIALTDLRLRDLILAHAGQHPTSRKLWLETITKLREHPNFKTHIPLGAVECALLYLSGDLARARSIAERLVNLDGTYSLALLLHKGLITKAPPQTLETAFRNASMAELLGDDDSDDNGQAA